MKKILFSILLCAVMLISVLPMMTFAADRTLSVSVTDASEPAAAFKNEDPDSAAFTDLPATGGVTGIIVPKGKNDSDTAAVDSFVEYCKKYIKEDGELVLIDCWYESAGVTFFHTWFVTIKDSNVSYTDGGSANLPAILSAVNSPTTEYDWWVNGSFSASRAITLMEAKNGEVTANTELANEGSTVTLTVAPAKGYTLETLTVKDSKNNEIALTAEKLNETYTFKMPASDVTVSASFMEDNTILDYCTDVNAGDWFYDDVLYVYKNGLMNGMSSDTFSPNSDTTRAMVVTILYRFEGEPVVSGVCPFGDVTADDWFAYPVLWAQVNGIVKGYSADSFCPNIPVTREQMMTIFYRYAQYKGYDVSIYEDTNILSFNDASQISNYAFPALQWACGAGLLNGDDNGNLLPAGNTTRAQVAAILHRFCEKIVK